MRGVTAKVAPEDRILEPSMEVGWPGRFSMGGPTTAQDEVQKRRVGPALVGGQSRPAPVTRHNCSGMGRLSRP